jgi:hypothetical protein
LINSMLSLYPAPLRVLILCVGLLAIAGPVHATARYLHATAGNMDIVSGMSEERTKRFLHELVGVRLLIEDLLDTPILQNSTQVIVFGSQSEMTDFYPGADELTRIRITWYCTTSEFGDTFSVVHNWPNDKRHRQNALHAYASWLISRSFRECPYWLNHGLSRFLSTLEYRDGAMRLGASAIEHPDDDKPAKRIPLAETLNKSWGSKDTYGLWRLWLTEDYEGNRTKIRQLANLIRGGAPGNADTVSQVFGRPIAEMQAALYKHMRSFGDVTVDRPSLTNPVLADVTFTPATPFELAMAKDMVLSTMRRRPPSVKPALLAQIKDNAPSPRPAEALARLELADLQLEAADQFWLLAAAKGTANSYAYLVVLRKVIEPRISRINLQPSLTPERATELRQLADRCAAIDPGRYEAHVWSAWLETIAPDPQVERLERVLQSQARYMRPDVFLPLAIANIRLKRFAEATALLDEYDKQLANHRAYSESAVEFLRQKILSSPAQ